MKSVIALKKSRGGVRRHTHTTIGRDNFPKNFPSQKVKFIIRLYQYVNDFEISNGSPTKGRKLFGLRHFFCSEGTRVAGSVNPTPGAKLGLIVRLVLFFVLRGGGY